MNDESKTLGRRRTLLAGTGLGCAFTALGGAIASARADEHAGHRAGAKAVPAVVVDAAREGICATCRFWGGMRRVAEDRSSVFAESLGWCNNADSPHFQSMRSPEAGPMKAWRKWEALG